MIAASCYDDCEAMRVAAERRGDIQAAIRAEFAMAAWVAQVPALSGIIRPWGDRFTLTLFDGRVRVLDARTLYAAQREALTWGVRVLDITACGAFA